MKIDGVCKSPGLWAEWIMTVSPSQLSHSVCPNSVTAKLLLHSYTERLYAVETVGVCGQISVLSGHWNMQ